jgi:hypothetical protein
VAPAAGLVVRAPLEGLQVAQVVVADEHDVAAAAAVAAVRAARGDVGLRRKDCTPFPPGPACTKMRALS